MMDHQDNVGIPDDLRCKRSDGKQWRCTAMSMPDKTVCEKHYIQAKKRAANSAMRASMKKAKRKPVGETDIYLESKSDDMDVPLSSQFGDYSGSSVKKKKTEKVSKSQVNYSPEITPVKTFSGRSSLRSPDDLDRDGSEYEDSRRTYRTPPTTSAVDSDRDRSQKTFEISPTTDTSDGSSESSDDNEGQTCHQCRGNIRDGVIWCQKCDKKGYCENCISTWYPDLPVEEIQSVCPACRGTCSCRVCMRGDNLVKARIREIPAKDKLQYLYCLLSAVLPVVKQIHSEQCSEVELEKRLRGNEIDLTRTKLNADDLMCCDFCRIPIIDYHRHCTNCSYDLCLSCCKDVKEASLRSSVKKEINHTSDEKDEVKVPGCVKLPEVQLNSLKKFPDWEATSDGSILCPPKAYGGCSSSVLTLKRIFKMNWVAKLVKNVEEMVNGCKVVNSVDTEQTGDSLKLLQAAYRENVRDNFLYYPSSEDLKNEGIKEFRMHWSRGKPVIVKEVCDASTMSIWDPMVIWTGIKETAEEKLKGVNRIVKAVDCIDRTEINIELEEFMKGYFDGKVHENGEPQLLKLKDWPSPSASEEFLLYQRPDFISKIPLLEFIHSKWGLLNVAAKLPHYSLQNDVGPKIFISYGREEEIGEGDSTDNLHLCVRDMVFLLVHTCEANLKDTLRTKTEIQIAPENHLNSIGLPGLSSDGPDASEANTHSNNYDEKMDDPQIEGSSSIVEEKAVDDSENGSSERIFEKTQAGALWDVFRREDIPKLMKYISMHCKDLRKADNLIDDCVSQPLYDGVVYLNRYHISKLKEEFGVEPWTFEQHIWEAVFVPAGCPFQVRHLQSSVQLGLDFLSPESLGEARKLSKEIRGLPNNHEAKLQALEVGKISLYAASSSIKEVQKLVLDPKLGLELGYEDPNLTSLVSQNLENMIKHKQITCP